MPATRPPRSYDPAWRIAATAGAIVGPYLLSRIGEPLPPELTTGLFGLVLFMWQDFRSKRTGRSPPPDERPPDPPPRSRRRRSARTPEPKPPESTETP